MIMNQTKDGMIREGPEEKDRVLIMDDEELMRELFQDMLRHLGYDSESAGDGKKAIELFVTAKEKGSPFEKVILDLTVPYGMGGEETMKELLKIDPQIKAIVSSGFPDDPVMLNYKKYGFQAALLKPYNFHELEEMLNQLV